MKGKNKIHAMRCMGTFKTLIDITMGDTEDKETQALVNDAIATLNDAFITQAETLDELSKQLDDLQKYIKNVME